MLPLVAVSIVPRPGRLLCAYFHISTPLSRQTRRVKVDQVDVIDPHFITVREIRIDNQMLRIFPSNCADKN